MNVTKDKISSTVYASVGAADPHCLKSAFNAACLSNKDLTALKEQARNGEVAVTDLDAVLRAMLADPSLTEDQKRAVDRCFADLKTAAQSSQPSEGTKRNSSGEIVGGGAALGLMIFVLCFL